MMLPFFNVESVMRRMTMLVTALVSVGVSAGSGAAESFGPMGAAPAAHAFTVGELKLTALRDGQVVVPNDGKSFGIGVDTGTMSNLLNSAARPTDRISLSVNALLVRSGHRLVLIDTGLGPKVHGALLGSLQEVGVKPDAITDVLITHSHFDHVGGLLDDAGHLAFPKAKIHMSSAEWAWLQTTGPAELVKAISSRMSTFEPGAKIVPGITSVALNGHTPGHVGYEIASGDNRLLDIGDIAHSTVVSLRKPNWSMAYDKDDASAKATRATTLKKLADSQELVFSPHFPYPGVGHITAVGDGFEWNPSH
jgi:glyoxylase-like metal-dependent hydrolase (beta-lactamase superfamily II)